MKSDKLILAPVLLCLMFGVLVAMLFPTTKEADKKPQVPTNSAPEPILAATNFTAYIASGRSNLQAQLSAATNPVERAVWEDIIRRFEQVNWTNVAKTLNRTNP